jgi:hypothetical protein
LTKARTLFVKPVLQAVVIIAQKLRLKGKRREKGAASTNGGRVAMFLKQLFELLFLFDL